MDFRMYSHFIIIIIMDFIHEIVKVLVLVAMA